MISLDPLTGMALLVLAAGEPQVKFMDGCKIPRPAQISVVPRTEKVKIDKSMSLEAMQMQKIDTINPYGYDQNTHTNGYMTGEIGMSSEVHMDYAVDRRTGGYCLWYDKVNVTIEIDPTIVIASEVAADNCMHRAVYNHELRHVNVDRKIVNKYAKSIGRKVFDGLEQRGFLVGPIPAPQAQATADRMKSTVAQLIELESKKMEIERMESQQAVDSLEEYQRVKSECPNFNPMTLRPQRAHSR